MTGHLIPPTPLHHHRPALWTCAWDGQPIEELAGVVIVQGLAFCDDTCRGHYDLHLAPRRPRGGDAA